MNIVSWLYLLQQELLDAGQERVASLIDRIPELVHEGESSQAESLLPEALAAARALRNGWLEVYFRHWEMRNRLGNLGEGETALSDVVALLEFAHREENGSCPQSVCTTHDISDCYARIDGPGWAEERKAVCEETLARLSPAWPCYTCLNREYVDALVDQRQYDAALERLDGLSRVLRENGIPEDSRTFLDRAVIFHRQGHHQQALDMLDRAVSFDEDMGARTAFRTYCGILRARILVCLAREDEAWEIFPRWGGIDPGDYRAWAETAFALVREGSDANSWALCTCLRQAQINRNRAASHRECIEIGAIQAELAMKRGISWTAEAALALAEQHLPRLRAPHGADTLLRELRNELSAMPPVLLPVPTEELPQWLADLTERDPEKEVEWLLAALRQSPDSLQLTLLAAEGMEACNAYEEAAALLQRVLTPDSPNAEDILFRLVGMHLGAGNEKDALDATVMFDDENPGLAHWARAYIAIRREMWPLALDEAAEGLKHRPEELGLLRFTAIAHMRLNDFTQAAEAWRRAIAVGVASGEDMTGDRWELMVAASAAQNWEEVRSLCEVLNIPLASETGPVEEDWGWVRLRFFEEGGWREYLGRRAGPCTARVVSIANPEDIQHVRDVVVFDPSYIEDPPEDEEERRDYIAPHIVVHVLHSAGYTSWICDGADPGEALFEAFCRETEERGLAVRLRQREGYTVKNPDVAGTDFFSSGIGHSGAGTAKRLPGIYFAVASPPEMSPREVSSLLTELTAGWPHPLCFRDLVQAAGADTASHDAVIEQYGL